MQGGRAMSASEQDTKPRGVHFLSPESHASLAINSDQSLGIVSPAFVAELAVLDKDEQDNWLNAIEAGQNSEAAYLAVREKYHSRFLDIVKRYNRAPVFRVQYPAPFVAEQK